MSRLVLFRNPDKKFQEKWYSGRHPLNFPHAFRACLYGKTGCGKTTVILNMILKQKPRFQRIIISHGAWKTTKEYDKPLGKGLFEIRGDIPHEDEIDGVRKTLLIIDDIDLKALKDRKDDDGLIRLKKMFKHVSSHRNLSIICSTHYLFEAPVVVRHCSDIFIVWKPNDMSAIKKMSKRVGLYSSELERIFLENCKKKHDAVWIDQTPRTRFPIRINGTLKVKGPKPKFF